jgi:hypothetical protein
MSSKVFLNGNIAFLLLFLIDLLIVYLMVKKMFNLHKKFPEKKTYFFYNIITFSRSSKRPNRQKAFFKTLNDPTLNFFSKIMRYVFIWMFPDFVDTLYA